MGEKARGEAVNSAIFETFTAVNDFCTRDYWEIGFERAVPGDPDAQKRIKTKVRSSVATKAQNPINKATKAPTCMGLHLDNLKTP